MFKYNCLNPIASVGLDLFSGDYEKVEDLGQADAALVRSAAMHELELPDSLLAVARAGAGVNNIPLDKCAEQGIVVFNTPGANANGVKELVIYYDYMGIEMWATGDWKRNKAGTIAYYEFMQKVKNQISLTFVKVKGHSGIAGNEEADRLAKEAVGID